jgi:hypothetical protein
MPPEGDTERVKGNFMLISEERFVCEVKIHCYGTGQGKMARIRRFARKSIL